MPGVVSGAIADGPAQVMTRQNVAQLLIHVTALSVVVETVRGIGTANAGRAGRGQATHNPLQEVPACKVTARFVGQLAGRSETTGRNRVVTELGPNGGIKPAVKILSKRPQHTTETGVEFRPAVEGETLFSVLGYHPAGIVGGEGQGHPHRGRYEGRLGKLDFQEPDRLIVVGHTREVGGGTRNDRRA